MVHIVERIKGETAILGGMVWIMVSHFNWIESSYLFAAIHTCVLIGTMFRTLYHVNYLSLLIGDQIGSLILTLSVVTIESFMLISLLEANDYDSLVLQRSIISSIMISINLVGGLCLAVSLFNKDKKVGFNNLGTSSYMAMISFLYLLFFVLPSTGLLQQKLSMIRTIFTPLSILLYILFLCKQTITHPDYFLYTVEQHIEQEVQESKTTQNIYGEYWYHLALMFFGLMTTMILCELLIDAVKHGLHVIPQRILPYLSSLLVLLPEGISAIRAVAKNQMQKSLNLFLGSATATLSLTLPITLLYAQLVQVPVSLVLSSPTLIITTFTILFNSLLYASGEINWFYGCILLMINVLYLIAI